MKLYALMTNPDGGYKIDSDMASELDPFKFYEVSKVNIGRSSTHVTLQNNYKYNSVNFTFYVFRDDVVNFNTVPVEYDIWENNDKLEIIVNDYEFFKKLI